MKVRQLLVCLIFGSLLCCQLGFGWWEAGHFVVAEIAYQRLDPCVKAKVDSLAAQLSPSYSGSSAFVNAATWLDELHGHDVGLFKSWHYTLIPYDPEGILSDVQIALIQAHNQHADILFALTESFKVLKSPRSTPFEKGLMLRMLTHCVADVHQPLHTVSKFDREHPQGDRGGNGFKVNSPLASNLHALWDSALGALPYAVSPLDEPTYRDIQRFALELCQHCPEESSLDFDPEGWAEESARLAIEVVYTLEPNSVPSRVYLEKGQEVAKQQLVKAGYRLAALLNQVF